MDSNKENKTSLKPVASVVRQNSEKPVVTKVKLEQQTVRAVRGSVSAPDPTLSKRTTVPSRSNPIPLPTSRPPSGRPDVPNKVPVENAAKKPAVISKGRLLPYLFKSISTRLIYQYFFKVINSKT